MLPVCCATSYPFDTALCSRELEIEFCAEGREVIRRGKKGGGRKASRIIGDGVGMMR